MKGYVRQNMVREKAPKGTEYREGKNGTKKVGIRLKWKRERTLADSKLQKIRGISLQPPIKK